MVFILASTNLLTTRIAAGCFAVALLIVLFVAKNVSSDEFLLMCSLPHADATFCQFIFFILYFIKKIVKSPSFICLKCSLSYLLYLMIETVDPSRTLHWWALAWLDKFFHNYIIPWNEWLPPPRYWHLQLEFLRFYYPPRCSLGSPRIYKSSHPPICHSLHWYVAFPLLPLLFGIVVFVGWLPFAYGFNNIFSPTLLVFIPLLSVSSLLWNEECCLCLIWQNYAGVMNSLFSVYGTTTILS